jgi:hypothetical protein
MIKYNPIKGNNMSTYKVTKNSNSVSSNESENLNLVETLESENIDNTMINNYQELNNKCDKVITKIKNRKLKK